MLYKNVSILNNVNIVIFKMIRVMTILLFSKLTFLFNSLLDLLKGLTIIKYILYNKDIFKYKEINILTIITV